MRIRIFSLAALALLLALVDKPVAADQIGQQIATKEPAQIDQAVANISSQLHAAASHDRRVAVNGLVREDHWLKRLLDAGRCDDVIRLSLEGTCAVPWDPALVESLQTYRVKALLEMGKPEESLAVAKGVFNLCQMRGAANALLLIVGCLQAARPGDVGIIDRLRDEQIAGSTLPSQQKPLNAKPSNRSSVLDGIKVDGTVYEKAITQYSGDTYGDLMSRGNVLLLADRPKEARAAFERAYALASDNDLPTATESIARCIKAEDGTIGRANAWVLSIRPDPGR